MEKNQKNNNNANKRKKYTIYRKYTDIILIEKKQKNKRTKTKRQVLIRFFESAYLIRLHINFSPHKTRQTPTPIISMGLSDVPFS